MLAFAAGFLFFCGFVFLLRGRLLLLVFGINVLGNAANLLIFHISQTSPRAYPFIDKNGLAPNPYADPLPQALILTAIVIGFAILFFLIALIRKLANEHKVYSVAELREEE